MRCLVFGAEGYLGGHLVQALAASGHEVVAYPGGSDSDDHRIDLCDLQAYSKVDWNVDRVFLFAGVTGTAASFTDFQRFVQGNDIVLLNILDSIRRSGFQPRLIFPSSRLVYAGSDLPLPETAPLEATTIYAANKIGCELYLRAYANAFGVPFTVFRICVPYGNRRGARYSFGSVGNFIKQATENGCIRLYGDGGLRRTFSHVDDVCEAIVQGAARDDFENEIFNVPGENLSLLEAAQLIAARLAATIEFVPWPAFDRRIESGSTVFDGHKLLARLPGIVKHDMAAWAQTIPLQPAY